jgi:hypothetical protein
MAATRKARAEGRPFLQVLGEEPRAADIADGSLVDPTAYLGWSVDRARAIGAAAVDRRPPRADGETKSRDTDIRGA